MLKKIFWVVVAFVLIVWIGVGIYFLRTSRTSKLLPASPKETIIPTPQPTKPSGAENLDKVEFIAGNFEGWEEVEGSQDKYILLISPQTEETFPKIRIGFGFSPLFGYKESEDATVFAVTKNGEDYEVLGYFKDFTSDEMDKLVKNGDFVKVILKKEIVEETDDGFADLSTKNLKDENSNLLAHWFFIKREEGKIEVEQELGREFKNNE